MNLIAPVLDKVKFDEEIIDIMFNAAKERQLHDNSYVESIVTSCQNRLESLKAKETRLLDTFLDGQISKEIYDAKVLGNTQRKSLRRKTDERSQNQE
jgi:FixJ family two-component response regulator